MTEPAPKGLQGGLEPRYGDAVLSGRFFHPAVQEIGALGLRVDEFPHDGSRPYGLLVGHGGSRSWLVPLDPRRVSISSLVLIQPMRSTARMAKWVAVAAARCGLPWYGVGKRLYISGENYLTRSLGPPFTDCAFFTGTASPHRKLVIQLMDRQGGIHGYAKVSRSPVVHALLENEASAMREVSAAGLSSVVIPKVLLHKISGGAAVFVTDTTKRVSTRCIRRLTRRHLEFLSELAERTSGNSALGAILPGDGIVKLKELEPALSAAWRDRLQGALDVLLSQAELVASAGLAHGDFTPWNVFPHEERLCVIDWEYAGRGYPADYDLIHFLFSLSALDRSPPAAKCRRICRTLRTLGRSGREAHARVIAYLCTRIFFLAGRQLRAGARLHWEGEHELGLMLDALARRDSAVMRPRPA